MNAAVYDTKPYDRKYLEAEGVGIHWRFHEARLDESTVSLARGCTAACVFVNDVVDAAVMKALKESGIGLIALRCAGFNNVDLAAAKLHGIRVVRVPAYSPHAVAEHTVGLLLTLNRKIHRAYNRVREHNFSLDGLVGFDLYGKTIGVIGTGKIGRVTAGIFRGFGCRLLAHDPFPDSEWAKAAGCLYVSLEELLRDSDIVTLHLPLTEQSLQMLNEERIAGMKQGAYLINTSRGKLVDTAAVIEALKSGQLGGVALDVYEEEQGVFFEDLSGQVLLDDELTRLLTFPNVLVTSHQAFLTHEALTEIARSTAGNIRNFAEGHPPLQGTEL